MCLFRGEMPVCFSFITWRDQWNLLFSSFYCIWTSLESPALSDPTLRRGSIQSTLNVIKILSFLMQTVQIEGEQQLQRTPTAQRRPALFRFPPCVTLCSITSRRLPYACWF